MKKRTWLPLTLVLAVVGLYAIGGFWWAPQLVDQAFREFVAQRLGKSPSLAEVRFNPFTLELEASGIAIAEPDGAPLVSAERLYLNGSIASLWRRAVVLDAVALEQPVVAAVLRADRSLNLLGLIPPADANTPRAVPEQPLPAVELAMLTIRGGEVSFLDQRRAQAPRAELRPINVTLRDFSTRPGSGNAYSITAASPLREQFRWQGTFTARPFAARGRLSLEALRASSVQQHAGELLPFDLPAGLIGLSARYELASEPGGLAARLLLDALDVQGLELRSRGAGSSEVRLAQLAVRDASIDLAGRAVNLGTVTLSGASIDAVLDDSGWNLARLAPARASETAPPAEQKRWQLTLPKFELKNSALSVTDRKPAAPVTLALSGIEIGAAGYSNAPDAVMKISAQATLGRGGTLAAQLEATPGRGAASGSIQLGSVDLLAFEPYVASLVRLDLRAGALDLDGQFAIAPSDQRPLVTFRGEAAIKGLATTDRERKRDFVKWRRLLIKGIDYRSAPARLTIATIDAEAPYVDLLIGADGVTNISQVLGKAPQVTPTVTSTVTPTVAPQRSAERTMLVEIRRVRIAAGSANFEDLSVRPNFGTGIQTLSGTITGLSSRSDSRAEVALEGAVDKYAPVKIAGQVNYLAAQSFTDLRASFRNLELTTLNPYSGKFAGYEIERGKLSVDFAYRIENRQLDAKHKILVSQLQLGKRVESKDATKLPIRLAIALLKDGDGNIDIDLPITGSLDDPQFRIGPIIWKMVINLFTKIIASPFKLLGSLFGGGDQMQFIDFSAGKATLDAAMLERLSAVRKALASRPQLQIDVPLGWNRELDVAALRAERWAAELEQFAPAAQRAAPARYLKALSARYAAVSGQKPGSLLDPLSAPDPATGAKPDKDTVIANSIERLEAELRGRIEIADSQLETLGRERAKAIQDALLSSGEIDPLRVFITSPIAAPAESGNVRLELSLKT